MPTRFTGKCVDVANVLTWSKSPPFCLKCNRPVEYWSYETPVETIQGWQGSVTLYTGEIIITVGCHGETWKESIFQGVIS